MQRAHQAQKQTQQALGENERLKQLLDVNGIPFPRNIPQPDPLDIDRPPVTQQLGGFPSPSSTSSLTIPVPPNLFSAPSSNSADIASHELRRDSNASSCSPMDSVDEYDIQGNSPQMQGYPPYTNSHQASLESVSTSDASSERPIAPVTTSASASAVGPTAPTNSLDQFLHTSAQRSLQSINPVPDSALSAPGVDYFVSDASTSPTLVNAPIETIPHPDPLAIKDHDQTGVEFILAYVVSTNLSLFFIQFYKPVNSRLTL